MAKLEGKVAVVTGASSGIGKATAILFAEEKAKVVIAARRLEALEETISIIKSKQGDAIAVKADVTLPGDAENLFNKTIQQYGRLDILFNNAGVEQLLAPVHEITVEEWDRVINTNLRGMFLCMKYAIPYMLEKGGVIINSGSPASFIGQAYSPAYCSSKAGVLGLTRAAAFDYGENNIRINCFCPAATETPMLGRVFNNPAWKKIEAKWIHQVPIKRFVQPEEMAKAVLFLASDDSSIATGASFVFDGGLTAI